MFYQSSLGNKAIITLDGEIIETSIGHIPGGNAVAFNSTKPYAKDVLSLQILAEPKIVLMYNSLQIEFDDEIEHTISIEVEAFNHFIDYNYINTVTVDWDLSQAMPIIESNYWTAFAKLENIYKAVKAGQVVYGQFNNAPVMINFISGSFDGDFFDYTIKFSNGLINYTATGKLKQFNTYSVQEEINESAAHTFIDRNIDYIYDKIIERTEQLKNS